jgi:hypothetical protein
VEGDIKGLTLHWGVSMNTADEWITPQAKFRPSKIHTAPDHRFPHESP